MAKTEYLIIKEKKVVQKLSGTQKRMVLDKFRASGCRVKKIKTVNNDKAQPKTI